MTNLTPDDENEDQPENLVKPVLQKPSHIFDYEVRWKTSNFIL